MKIKIFTALLAFAVLFITPPAFAQDLSVSCSGSGCTPSSATALFTSTEKWYPGKTITKVIRITNASTNPQDVATKSQNASATGLVDTVTTLSIRRVSTNIVVWSGSLNNFYGAGDISLATFAAGAVDEFAYAIALNQSATNGFQSKETAFDLLLGFVTADVTPTPTPTPTSGGGGGDGGGGTVLGAGVSATVCNDTAPGGSPSITSANAGTNSVTLTWTQAANPVTYYLVAYGTSSGNYSYGNPNVGGSGTTSYTVSNLSGGTTYYFVVRAGNGCKPGSFSGEVNAAPGGGAASGIAPGFAPGVLGVQTQPEASGSATPSAVPEQILGEQAGPWIFPWWYILIGLGLGGIGTLIFFIFKRVQ